MAYELPSMLFSMFFQPLFCFLVVRHDGGDQIPESGGMVVVDQMCQFVDDDVIEYVIGAKEQTGRKAYVTGS